MLNDTAILKPIKRGRTLLSNHPWIKWGFLGGSGLLVIAILVWQAMVAGGNPDPAAHGISPEAGIFYTAVLVYREGLEAILVLSAVIAGLIRTQKVYWKPIVTGSATGILASVATWFVLIGILALASSTVSELNLQVITGLIAIVVLLIVMNWFFHKVYWTGWISFHNKKKKEYIDSAESSNNNGVKTMAYQGLFLLGFSCIYREGFEVDLFLQNLRIQIGSLHVYLGCALALVLILITGYFVFVAHQKLPYKKMLIFTGVMLGFVLLVMVGEQIQEMQLANWISTTPMPIHFPDWAGLWFSIFNNWETVIAQIIAFLFVAGSYFVAERGKSRSRRSVSRAKLKPSKSVELDAAGE